MAKPSSAKVCALEASMIRPGGFSGSNSRPLTRWTLIAIQVVGAPTFSFRTPPRLLATRSK